VGTDDEEEMSAMNALSAQAVSSIERRPSIGGRVAGVLARPSISFGNDAGGIAEVEEPGPISHDFAFAKSSSVVGSDGYCSPRQWVPFNARGKVSKCVR
jgi:hypothetical protein